MNGEALRTRRAGLPERVDIPAIGPDDLDTTPVAYKRKRRKSSIGPRML